MKEVTVEERTEIQGGYCPIVNGLCRMDCRFLVDVEEGCMIEKIFRNTEILVETLEEQQGN